MLSLFNRWKPKQEIRLRGHDKWVYGLRTHPNGEWVLSSGCDHTVRLFSSITGSYLGLFEGHQGSVWRVVFADENTFLSASDDKTLRIWDIPGKSLTNTIKFDDNVWCVEKVGDDIFATGTIHGELHIHVKEGKEIVTRTSFQAHRHGVNCIASWGDRIGTASLDTTAKIWDANTLECLVTLTDHKTTCRVIAMSEAYIATASRDGTILVYNAVTFAMIRKITTHGRGCYIRCVRFVGSEEHLLSSADDKTIRLHNSFTGALLWTKHFAESATCSTVLNGGRIATGFASGNVVVYETPTNIAPHIVPVNTYRRAPCQVRTHPLRDALMSCVSGYSCPQEHCVDLIKYDACRVSFDEWCCAHRILMLALEDGDVLENTEFNGEHNWWYDNLYVAVRDIELTVPEYSRLKGFLAEAKERRVLESAEAVLTALHVTRDVRKNTVMMEKAGTLILERILRMEDNLGHLRKAYNRYVTYQRKSQLVGIALQVIPIAGGAIAGALSAGSEIVKGLSVKDVTDYAMGIGTNFAQSQIDDMGDRILYTAAETLSPPSVDNMDMWRRKRLEEVLGFCGIDINTIHQLFLRRIEDKNTIFLSQVKGTADQVALCDSFDFEEVLDNCTSVESMDSPEKDDETQHEFLNLSSFQNFDETIKKESGVTEECSPYPVVGESGRHDNHGLNHPFDVSTSSGHINDSAMSLAHLKRVNISARAVAELSQESIAQIWAAYACMFDAKDHEKFSELAESLSTVLVDNEIHGSELVDRRLLSVSEIMQLMEDGLQNRDKKISHGQRARIKRFLLEVSSDTCSCLSATKT